MRLHFFFALALVVLGTGCAGPARYRAIQELKNHPTWSLVRSAAQREVLRREIRSDWRLVASPQDNDALYPTEYKDGIWKVTAAADYPANRYGKVVHLEVSDDGRILGYRQLWKESNPAEKK